MQLIHETITGTHLLHWLTGAVPLATLLVVGGVLRRRVAARLLLVGVAMTLATVALTSTAPGVSQLRYGAPLPMVRAGLDPLTGDVGSSITVLRACVVANLLFWCSTAVLLGVLIRSMVRRHRRWAPGARA